MEVARKVARNATYNFLRLLVGNVSGLFLTIILARILKPEQFGIYSLALSIALLSASLASLGIEGAVVRYVAYHLGKNNIAKVRGHVKYFLKFKVLLTVLVSLTLILLSDSLALIFDDGRLKIPFILAGVIVFFSSFSNFLNAFFIGLQEFKYSFLKQAVYETARWIFVLSLAIYYLASGALAGVSMAYFTSLIFLYSILITKYKEFVIGFSENIDKKVNAFIGFMSIAGISGIIYTYVDSVMIGYFLTPTDVGFYRAAYTIVFAIIGLISSLSSVLFPAFTQLSIEDLNKSLERLSKYTSIIAFPTAFAIAYLSNEIIKVIYGREYLPAVLPMIVLSFALIPAAFNYLGTIFNAKERPEINASIITVSMTLNVLLNYILITSMGIVGAALATVISRFFVLLVVVILLYKIFNIVPRFRVAFKPLIASLLMFAVLLAFPKATSLVVGIIEVFVAFAAYLIALILLRAVTMEDVRYLRRIIAY